MKLAIGFFGEIRTFEYAYKFWNINQNISVDYFISTWNESRNLRKYIYSDINEVSYYKDKPHGLIPNDKKIDFYEKVDEYSIKKIIKNPVNLKITNRIYSSENATTNMVFHMKNCIDMILESNNEYDFILLIRPDYILKFTNIEDIKDDIIYHSGHFKIQDNSNLESYTINDVFWFGSFDLICKFVKEIPSTLSIHHAHFAHYLYNSDFKFEETKNISGAMVFPSVIPFLRKLINDKRNPFTTNKWYSGESTMFEQLSIVGSETFNKCNE